MRRALYRQSDQGVRDLFTFSGDTLRSRYYRRSQPYLVVEVANLEIASHPESSRPIAGSAKDEQSPQ
jgi:hypothetical protein